MSLETLTTDVVIVGAGPVGLTLAMDLASRGVRVAIAETRHRGEPPNVKCNHVSARTMEQFRRLGVAAAVRDAGLPADHPNDVVFRTTFSGQELKRIPNTGHDLDLPGVFQQAPYAFADEVVVLGDDDPERLRHLDVWSFWPAGVRHGHSFRHPTGSRS